MNFNFSVGQRITLGFLIMILLVVVTSMMGLWYATSAEGTVGTIHRGLRQFSTVSDLQLSWLGVVATVDRILLTRQTDLIERSLNSELAEFEQQLAILQTQLLNQAVQTSTQDQEIAGHLQLLGDELTDVVIELTELTRQGRWARAQTLRHTELASLQRRLDENLAQLRTNIESNVDLSVVASLRAQNLAHVFLIAAIGVALLIGILLIFLVSRSIIRPVNELTEHVRRIQDRDFSHVDPLARRDEIGDLSRAFTLMTDWLRESYEKLEQRVAARTRRLEIIAKLGEHLSAILKLEELLTEVVTQIKDNFDYYHAHIYLIDEEQKKLIMTVGTGEAGAEMKARGHGIPVDAQTSLVARAARSGEIVWVDNVREAVDWLPNPLLPDTHSEMAVPIILDGKAVGVLDVQDDEVAGLDEGDASLLRSLANQVAVSIRNARLFDEVETALAQAKAAQERYLEQAWQKVKNKSQRGQYHYTRPGVPVLDEKSVKDAKQQCLPEPQLILSTSNSNQPGSQSILAPITYRSKRIGTLQLHPSTPDQTWSEDDLEIVEAVVSQLAETAESLRLFEETQEQASRERLIGQIGDKLRRAPDLDSLMKIGVEELSHVLNSDRAFIRLRPTSATITNSNGSDSTINSEASIQTQSGQDNLS